MTSRPWDAFLSERDRRWLSEYPARPGVGLGARPALLIIDNSNAIVGKRSDGLLDSVRYAPLSMGGEAWTAIDRTKPVLEAFRRAGLLVVHTTLCRGENAPRNFMSYVRDRSERPTRSVDDDAVLAGEDATDPWDIIAELSPTPEEPLLEKMAPSAFWGTPLPSILLRYSIDTLLVAGNSTSGCIRATVVDGASSCLRVSVIEDCVFDRTQASHAMSLFDMEQKYADLITAEDAVAYADGLASRSGA
jgi:maleamate amidohydrolase